MIIATLHNYYYVVIIIGPDIYIYIYSKIPVLDRDSRAAAD